MLEQPIKLIATDLDGTLLTTDHTISPRTERVLKLAMAQGVDVILATGKTPISRDYPVQMLGLTTPGVFSQGLMLINGDGSVRDQRLMPPNDALIIAEYAEANGMPLVAYNGMSLLTEALSTLTEFMMAHHEPMPELCGPLSELVTDTPINKLVMGVEPEQLARVKRDLAAATEGDLTMVTSLGSVLELLPPGASKGDGLMRLLDDLGVDPVNVMALGDGENDIEMLQMVGWGVAMANAPENVKASADHVTASNDEDGVALAVEKFVLNGG